MFSRKSYFSLSASKLTDKSSIIDILFPGLCPCCGEKPAGENTLCRGCESSIDYLYEFSVCYQCGAPFGYFAQHSKGEDENRNAQRGNLCSKCLNGRYCFNKARSAALYQGAVRELLHGFKYEGKLKLLSALCEIIIENPPLDLTEFDVLVPVPLFIGKLRQRQYNQSAELAKALGRHFGVRADLLGLVKTRDTAAQIEIKDEAKRRRNVRGAFKVRDGSPFKALNVLLIDDVFTTGSTSDECSKTLLKSGAHSVEVLTLARARSI